MAGIEKIGKVDFLTRLMAKRASESPDIAAYNYYGYGSVSGIREGLARVMQGDRVSSLTGSDYIKGESFGRAAKAAGLGEDLIARAREVGGKFSQEEYLQLGQAVLRDMAGEDGRLNWKDEAHSFIQQHDLAGYGHDLVTLKHVLDHDPSDFTATIGRVDEVNYSDIFKDLPPENLTRPDPFNPQYIQRVGADHAYLPSAKALSIAGVSGVAALGAAGAGAGAPALKAVGAPTPQTAALRVGSGSGEFDDSQLCSAPRNHRSGNPQLQQVINQPGQGLWITDFSANPYEAIDKLGGTITEANARRQVPVVVSYFIKGRDQAEKSAGGTHSAGGANSVGEWRQYYQALSRQIGNGEAIVVMEPDALGHSVNDNNFTKASLIREAVEYLRGANPNIKIALDIGNSAWMRNHVGEAVNMLKAAGMEYADYFTSNIAQSESLGNEIAHIEKMVAALDAKGIEGKKGIIDTSRNGLGPGDGATYNPKGVSLGHKPTFNTHSEDVAAYLWLKTPGQWDGGGGIRAGQFVESYLDMLHKNAINNRASDYNKS
ncbi:MAG: glycoside hydrolase family 6 protein [Limnobacter sp.]|nr:glycoside hydrolase family 6 protein [Limnobacter sp.]